MTPLEKRALSELRRYPKGMKAGELGFVLWAKPWHSCKDENQQTTMFCRPAGKLLSKLRRDGLVDFHHKGRNKYWFDWKRPQSLTGRSE